MGLFGKKEKVTKEEKIMNELTPYLLDGEQVEFIYDFTDLAVITNKRLIVKDRVPKEKNTWESLAFIPFKNIDSVSYGKGLLAMSTICINTKGGHIHPLPLSPGETADRIEFIKKISSYAL